MTSLQSRILPCIFIQIKLIQINICWRSDIYQSWEETFHPNKYNYRLCTCTPYQPLSYIWNFDFYIRIHCKLNKRFYEIIYFFKLIQKDNRKTNSLVSPNMTFILLFFRITYLESWSLFRVEKSSGISYLVLKKAQEIQFSSNRFNLPHKFQESIYFCYISYNFSPPELISQLFLIVSWVEKKKVEIYCYEIWQDR